MHDIVKFILPVGYLRLMNSVGNLQLGEDVNGNLLERLMSMKCLLEKKVL